MKKQQACFSCGRTDLDRDEIALNKKLRGEDIDHFYCLPCFAESLEVTVEELLAKIEEFKAEGCKLFT